MIISLDNRSHTQSVDAFVVNQFTIALSWHKFDLFMGKNRNVRPLDRSLRNFVINIEKSKSPSASPSPPPPPFSSGEPLDCKFLWFFLLFIIFFFLLNVTFLTGIPKIYGLIVTLPLKEYRITTIKKYICIVIRYLLLSIKILRNLLINF